MFATRPASAWLTILFWLLISISFGIASAGTIASPTTPSHAHQAAQSTGAVFYVSRDGTNSDGRSWATAWNELDRINWAIIQPGDTILIDGGDPWMFYFTTLTIGKSGVPGAPITIRMAQENGRNGRVLVYGGRPTTLPYCGQANYTEPTTGVRDIGIQVGSAGWIVIDGGKWRGITIYRHNVYGINFSRDAHNVIVRNVEILDNGNAFRDSSGKWQPNQEGVNLSGINITIERAIIHDNGQDAIQSAGGLRNFTLRSSWLYNSRGHPTESRPFNHCRHSDGIQIFGGGFQSGVLIEDSVIGPGFLQGLLLGEGPVGEEPWAVVNDVTIRHTLLTRSSNSNISGHDTKPANWTLEHVTSYRDVDDDNNNVEFQGVNHVVRNSIFYGGMRLFLRESNLQLRAENNCQWQINDGLDIGIKVDPRFMYIPWNNFELQAGSPCVGKGSRITSTNTLFGLPGAIPRHFVFLPLTRGR